MTIGYFRNIGCEEGLTYKVRNVGTSEIPEFQIVLSHPNRGSMAAFNSKMSGPLLPDQTREYQCVLYKNGSPEAFLAHWISHEKDQLVQTPSFDQFRLSVRMLNSEKTFLESDRMGNALAKDWYRSLVLKQPGRATWDDHKAMNSRPPFGIKYWLERRQQKKELDAILAQHKASDDQSMDRSGGSSAS